MHVRTLGSHSRVTEIKGTHHDGFSGMGLVEVQVEGVQRGHAHVGAQVTLVGEPFQVVTGDVRLQILLSSRALPAAVDTNQRQY